MATSIGTGDPSVVWTDDTHDRTSASNGRSRYGAYLARNRQRFAADTDFYHPDDIHQGIIADPVGFTVAAWQAATGPIMVPPYVQTHLRVVDARLEGATVAAGIVAIVTLAGPVPQGIPTYSSLSPWRSWAREYGGYRPPEDDRLAMLAMLELRIPVPVGALPRPHRPVTAGVPDVLDAKDALGVVVRMICQHANPVLEALEALEGESPQ